MNAEIFRVSHAQFMALTGHRPEYDVIGKLCEDIIVGMFGGVAMVFIGLSPRTILSTEAYAWMIVTDEGQRHPLLLARYAKGVRDTILGKYSMIYGHCFAERSANWLRSLGATFVSETEFEIRRG